MRQETHQAITMMKCYNIYTMKHSFDTNIDTRVKATLQTK